MNWPLAIAITLLFGVLILAACYDNDTIRRRRDNARWLGEQEQSLRDRRGRR